MNFEMVVLNKQIPDPGRSMHEEMKAVYDQYNLGLEISKKVEEKEMPNELYIRTNLHEEVANYGNKVREYWKGFFTGRAKWLGNIGQWDAELKNIRDKLALGQQADEGDIVAQDALEMQVNTNHHAHVVMQTEMKEFQDQNPEADISDWTETFVNDTKGGSNRDKEGQWKLLWQQAGHQREIEQRIKLWNLSNKELFKIRPEPETETEAEDCHVNKGFLPDSEAMICPRKAVYLPNNVGDVVGKDVIVLGSFNYKYAGFTIMMFVVGYENGDYKVIPPRYMEWPSLEEGVADERRRRVDLDWAEKLKPSGKSLDVDELR